MGVTSLWMWSNYQISRQELAQHSSTINTLPVTAILVRVILVWWTEITREIGPSPDILVQVADHASALEIVCPGHLAASLAL